MPVNFFFLSQSAPREFCETLTDILCKDLGKDLQYLMGENKKKKLIFPLLPLERNGKMVYEIHDEIWLDYFSNATKEEKMRISY